MAAKKSTSPGKRTNRTAIKKEQALEGYVEKGTVTAACKRAGIGRQTWYDWVKADPEFAKAADNAYEQVTDSIEQTSIEKARAGDTTLCIFLTKNRRHEVYGEKQHVTGDFSIDVGNPKETLAAGIAAIAKRRGKSRGDSGTDG